MDYVQIPRAILEQHQRVTLAVDVMFVNGVPFLVSVARGLNLVTAEFTPSRTAKQLAAGITRMIDLCARGGFQGGTVLIDNEFEKLQSLVPILAINTMAAKEHIPELKRKTRLIKEQGRGILNTLPFKKMPRLMLIELVYHVVLWLNTFLANSGVSKTPSPRKIVYRHNLDFAKPFRMYCKVHDEPAPTNTMVTRSTLALVIGPTGNLQGTYKFLTLSSLMFLKKKRDSLVKAQMCADGRKQMDGNWAKQGTTSPTVATELVFITADIDAHEGRNVACFCKKTSNAATAIERHRHRRHRTPYLLSTDATASGPS